MIQKEVEDCEGHLVALETLVSSGQSNSSQFQRLHAEWSQLLSAVRVSLEKQPLTSTFIITICGSIPRFKSAGNPAEPVSWRFHHTGSGVTQVVMEMSSIYVAQHQRKGFPGLEPSVLLLLITSSEVKRVVGILL